MKWKTMFLTMVLSIGFLAAIGAADQPKSHRITLYNASKIGTTDLKPGDYRLELNQPKVRLIELKTGKSVDLEAKVENLEKKVPSTTIQSEMVDGVTVIRQIHLGGSKTKIAFN